MIKKLLSNYSFSDGTIAEIILEEDDVKVKFVQWNETEIVLDFHNCWRMINCKSINIDIDDVSLVETSQLLDEVKNEIIETGGAEEANKIFQVSFISSWEDKEVLTLIAEDIKITT